MKIQDNGARLIIMAKKYNHKFRGGFFQTCMGLPVSLPQLGKDNRALLLSWLCLMLHMVLPER